MLHEPRPPAASGALQKKGQTVGLGHLEDGACIACGLVVGNGWHIHRIHGLLFRYCHGAGFDDFAADRDGCVDEQQRAQDNHHTRAKAHQAEQFQLVLHMATNTTTKNKEPRRTRSWPATW